MLYPGLPGHENHAISKQQQAGKNKKMFGGMLSVVITPDFTGSEGDDGAREGCCEQQRTTSINKRNGKSRRRENNNDDDNRRRSQFTVNDGAIRN